VAELIENYPATCGQSFPRHNHLHLREELLPFGLLLGGGELVIREAELFASHQSCPGMRLQGCPMNGPGFPEPS